MTYSTLLFELDADGIAVLTINRPDKLNALNSAVLDELETAIGRVASESEIRGLIITGAGPKAFVAGADIGEIAAVEGEATGFRLSERGTRVFRGIERLSKPALAAVNGFAFGGGCELAMACHMRFASPNAKFAQPEVKLGLIPGYGGTVRLPRLVGMGRALELLLTGAPIDADEALRIGLVSRVVPLENLVEAGKTLLRTILQNSPSAIRLALHSAGGAADLPLDEGLEFESRQFGIACASEDKNEGARAFLEKRPPKFIGR